MIKRINEIPEYKDVIDRYFVSDGIEADGQCCIYSRDKNGNLKRLSKSNGRYSFQSKDNKKLQAYIYRIAMSAFRPVKNSENLAIHHIDHNRLNNSLDNLMWISYSDHIKLHAKSKLTCERKSLSIRESYTDEVKKKVSECQSVKVDQYDMNGQFIKTWDSFKKASKSLKISHSNMVRSCLYYKNPNKNKYPIGRKSAGGYIWKYHNLLEV